MWSISELKLKAQEVLHRGYWKAVLAGLVFVFVGADASSSSASSSSLSGIFELLGAFTNVSEDDYLYGALAIGLFALAFIVILLIALAIGWLITAFLINPLRLGCQRYFLMSCIQDTELGELGYGFSQGNYLRNVKTLFFKELYTFLWGLLLWIPGIIKSYEYRMIPYLLAENPTLETADAFRISKEMMQGEKWNAFVLDLSFIGWSLLSVCTCGILALFYVTPYKSLTNAELYLALRYKVIGSGDDSQ